MLDDFKESQNVAYSLLVNSIACNKLSHAYLINANYSDEVYDFVMSFVKTIICEHHYVNFDKCGQCNKCHRIQNGNFPEVKIIEADSLVIKKEQLLELQSEFSRSSIEGSYRVYVIKDCDKMNKQASNCLLKFLEEPVSGVVAILVTNHISSVLSTIVSRCQVVHLTHSLVLNGKSTLENLAILSCGKREDVSSFLNDDSKKEIISSVLEFLDYFEQNGLDILIITKNMWYNKFQTREDNLLAFLLLVYFYYDVLKCKIGMAHYFFCDHSDFIQKIADYNSVDCVLQKIEVVHYGLDMVRCNLNINLLVDDIVIRLGECNEYSGSKI